MSVWVEKQERLCSEFQIKEFRAAFGFMTQVAFIAEELNHHPDWSNVYNTVKISLNTHDAGGAITDVDREMAKRIDALT